MTQEQFTIAVNQFIDTLRNAQVAFVFKANFKDESVTSFNGNALQVAGMHALLGFEIQTKFVEQEAQQELAQVLIKAFEGVKPN